MRQQKKYLSLVWLCILTNMSSLTAEQRIRRQDERKISRRVRNNAARTNTVGRAINNAMHKFFNPAELTTADYAASFTKILEHDATTGILTSDGQKNYYNLLTAIHGEAQGMFNNLQPAAGNVRVWVNPQAMYAYSLEGGDTCSFFMQSPPSLQSPEGAVEMLEVYGFALCRDVKFVEYGTGIGTDADGNGGSITNNVANVLNAPGVKPYYKGPRDSNGNVTPEVLFRGNSAGDLVGPYVSQFLLQPIFPLFPSGCAPYVAGLIGVGDLDLEVTAQKQYLPIPEGREFGVSWEDFIALQNGEIPKKYEVSDYNQNTTQYPINGRDMGGLVHTDGPYQGYYNALNILTFWDFPRSPVFPYYTGAIVNEGEGITMGPPDAYGLIGIAMVEALKAAWAQKWRAYRRLRPEAFAGHVQRAKVTNTNPYGIDPLLFAIHDGIDLLELVRERNLQQAGFYTDSVDTYLLAQMYPEGSPVHPSYPSGHATVAGACTTVIKAIFDDQVLLKDKFKPVAVDPLDPRDLIELADGSENLMTVASELDKLASNITHARAFGGVHYRADGDHGMLLGEQVAIALLKDRARTYTERGFTGFVLTKRNGQRIRITGNAVSKIA